MLKSHTSRYSYGRLHRIPSKLDNDISTISIGIGKSHYSGIKLKMDSYYKDGYVSVCSKTPLPIKYSKRPKRLWPDDISSEMSDLDYDSDSVCDISSFNSLTGTLQSKMTYCSLLYRYLNFVSRIFIGPEQVTWRVIIFDIAGQYFFDNKLFELIALNFSLL